MVDGQSNASPAGIPSDPLIADLVERCLLRPQDSWGAAVDAVCQLYPEHAEAIRRRFAEQSTTRTRIRPATTGAAKITGPFPERPAGATTIGIDPERDRETQRLSTEAMQDSGWGEPTKSVSSGSQKSFFIESFEDDLPADAFTQANADPEAGALPPSQGDLVFIREIGRGGMGVVYEAQDIDSGRRVAVKVVSPRFKLSPQAVERFEREARLAARISHPNCVFVYQAHKIGPQLGISMELMSGGTLEDHVDPKNPAPIAQSVRWIMDVLDGLGAAHAEGVIHRDVKPSNLFLTRDGTVKIGDFGLSRPQSGDLKLTTTGMFMGSPIFASPEQVRGRAVDERSDVYSVGATLYALLCGRPPHEADAIGDLLAKIAVEPVTAPWQLRKSLPRELGMVVLKALEKDARKRFQTTAEMRAALEPWSRRKKSAAQLGYRTVAYVADITILGIGFVVAGLAAQVLGFDLTIDKNSTVGWIAEVLIGGAYFTLMDGCLGYTLGKRLVGLRVVSADGSHPTPLRAAVRWAVLAANVVWPPMFGIYSNLIGLALFFLPFVPMRPWRGLVNGYQDRWSGTRIIQLGSPIRGFLRSGHFDPRRPAAGPGAPSFGVYRTVGDLGPTEFGHLYIGLDTRLDREVWIHALKDGAPNLAGELRSSQEPLHLRWLDGSEEDPRFDVYEAPGGASIAEHVAAARALEWPQLRRAMLQFAAHVRNVPTIVPARFWIDRRGELRLLHFALGQGSHEAIGSLDALCRAGAALAPLPSVTESMATPALPPGAVDVLRRMRGEGARYASFAELEQALEPLDVVPAELPRPLRVVFAVAPVLFWFAPIAIMGFAIYQAMTGGAKILRMGEGVDMERLPPDQALEAAKYGAWGLHLLFSAIGCTAAVVFRGGLRLTLLGITMLDSKGRHASRLRCFWRAFLGAAPFLVVPMLTITARREWFEVLPFPIAAAAVSALYVGAAVHAALTPGRTLLDRVSGTRLVR